MRQRRSTVAMFFCVLTAALLILDSRSAAGSARQAIDLCIRTLIPSLFPLFVLAIWLVPRLNGFRIPGLARFLGMPDGSEGIFLLGLVGGFPMGAACISQAVSEGNLSKTAAQRMLGICNNCGPAFVFGILSPLLGHPLLAVLLLAIQLETAILMGLLWPGTSGDVCYSETSQVSVPAAVRKACVSMANVCAWVILAAVATGFLRRWVFPLLSPGIEILLTGLMELTGGCVALNEVPSSSTRFIMAAVFVCFGGFSVLLQIQGQAALAGICMGTCVIQKTIQCLTAGLLAALCVRFGFGILLIPIPIAWFVKKAVEIPWGVLYNSPRKGGI